MTFNQWMAYIYRELGYNEQTILKYEREATNLVDLSGFDNDHQGQELNSELKSDVCVHNQTT